MGTGSVVRRVLYGALVACTALIPAIPAASSESSGDDLVVYTFVLPDLGLATAHVVSYRTDGVIESIASYSDSEGSFTGTPDLLHYQSMRLDRVARVVSDRHTYRLVAETGVLPVGGAAEFVVEGNDARVSVEGRDELAIRIGTGSNLRGTEELVYYFNEEPTVAFGFGSRYLTVAYPNITYRYESASDGQPAAILTTGSATGDSWELTMLFGDDYIEIQEPARGDPVPWIARHVIYGQGPHVEPIYRVINYFLFLFSVPNYVEPYAFPLINALQPVSGSD